MNSTAINSELGPLAIIGDNTGSLTRAAIEVATLLGYGPISLFADQLCPEGTLPVTVFPKTDIKNCSDIDCFVAITDADEREKLVQNLAALKMINLIHPSAVVSTSAQLGINIFVGPQTYIGMNAQIGDGVMQNALCAIEHDNIIGEYAFFGPGATLTGRVTIGKKAFIGAGVTIKPGVTVGENTVIGLGAVLVRDALANRIYMGNPAGLKE